MRTEMPPTIPLFDEPRRVAKQRSPYVRSVAQGTCPKCGQGQRKTGLVRSASHLAWQEHTYRTYSGAPMTCQASGVAICVLPPPKGKGGPKCPCGS